MRAEMRECGHDRKRVRSPARTAVVGHMFRRPREAAVEELVRPCAPPPGTIACVRPSTAAKLKGFVDRARSDSAIGIDFMAAGERMAVRGRQHEIAACSRSSDQSGLAAIA